ncbi:DUF2334 domain-containing protein [Pseudolysobacter antarcticus]|nr:polysaccharide deacetylase family protein [Pseudolysobacter antarcticus]
MNATKHLCIVLHDVAPATWPACRRLLDMLASLGDPSVTLLVVPDFHGSGRIDAAPDFFRSVDALAARDAEIALHGYFHRDDAPPPRSPGAWLRRRVLTAGEGEFATLDRDAAACRIRDGQCMLSRLGWNITGFVPPAWLASRGTHEALCATDLRYTSTHTALITLPDQRRIAAPCLTASTRSAWRRVASRIWLRTMSSIWAKAPLLRIGLHPDDASHPEIMVCWRKLIGALLQDRVALTKSQAIAHYQCAALARC